MPESLPIVSNEPGVDSSAQTPSLASHTQQKPPKSTLILLLTIAFILSMSAFGYTLKQYLELKKETKIAPQLPTAEKTKTEIKRTAEDENKYIYQVGNFEIKIDRDYIYLDSVFGEESSVSQSQALSGEEGKYCATMVGGVHTLWLERKYPGSERQTDPLTVNPLLIFEYWNPNKLVYLDTEAETEIKNRLQNFINLLAYTNRGELLEKVISITSSDYSIYTTSQLNPWSNTGVAGCGGVFSYPILIKKIDSQEYDNVFFVEVFEGNESSSPIMPTKKLIINKGRDWLLVTEQRRYEDWVKFGEQARQIASCPHGESEEWLRCNEQLWRENFRDENANQQWIERNLGFVTYTGNN